LFHQLPRLVCVCLLQEDFADTRQRGSVVTLFANLLLDGECLLVHLVRAGKLSLVGQNIANSM